MLRIEASNLSKVFNRRVVFQNISFSINQGQTLVVTGRNGSGKSTLAKVMCDVLSPSQGSIEFRSLNNQIVRERSKLIGFVSPYLVLYDEFTAVENLYFAFAIRGLPSSEERTNIILEKVGLKHRKLDAVRTYSSGMKQRLKYAFALIHEPPVLILDEPMANLDAEGISMVRRVMKEHSQHGILVVATNDLTDIDLYDVQVDLDAVN
jgi:heme exporter protein A